MNGNNSIGQSQYMEPDGPSRRKLLHQIFVELPVHFVVKNAHPTSGGPLLSVHSEELR
jgi:hypothetical protein